MSEKPNTAQKRALLIKLVVAGLMLLAAAALVLRGVDLRGALKTLLEWLRAIGPEAFFAANAVLPAFGVPASTFTLTAGPVFGPQIGLGMVLVYFGLSLAVNLALTYWLARYAFRPILNSIIARLGYKLPTVSKANQLNVALVVRITPGPPFVLQGYLLGLAELPFKIYMLVSWPVAMVYAVAVIVFGDALMQGKFKIAIIALIGLGVVGVGVKLLRQRYAKKPLESQVAVEPEPETKS